jgi:putrescine transport system ATP-binding protein
MDRGRVLQVGPPSEIYEFPLSRFVADFIGTINLFESLVTSRAEGMVHLECAEVPCELIVDEGGAFAPGQRVWLALRPEKIRLSRDAPARRTNCLHGSVWELGYLGNHSTYQIKTSRGKLVTVYTQNERRTAQAAIDWGDEVYVSWTTDAAVLLTS